MAQLKIITKSAKNGPYPKKYRDDDAIRAVVAYIFNWDKTYGRVGGWSVSTADVATVAGEMNLVSALWNQRQGVRLRHWIITFSRQELDWLEEQLHRPAADVVEELGWSCSYYYAARHQVVFGVHCDDALYHLHFAMNTVSYQDGKKYSGTKADLYQYTRYLKGVLNQYGLNLYRVTDQAEAKQFYYQ